MFSFNENRNLTNYIPVNYLKLTLIQRVIIECYMEFIAVQEEVAYVWLCNLS